MDIFAFQNLQTLGVNGFTLFVHNFVILKGMLSYSEVSALDSTLCVFDTARKHFRLQALVFLYLENLIELFHTLTAETPCKVVFKRYKEYRSARIALTTASATELVVDTARFVPFGA